jgi:hypothetical protein
VGHYECLRPGSSHYCAAPRRVIRLRLKAWGLVHRQGTKQLYRPTATSGKLGISAQKVQLSTRLREKLAKGWWGALSAGAPLCNPVQRRMRRDRSGCIGRGQHRQSGVRVAKLQQQLEFWRNDGIKLDS